MTGRIGVNAVGLVEVGVAADVLEEEGDERCLVFGGECGEDVAEGGAVGGAHRRWHLHAGDDDTGRRVFDFYGVDDGLEVGGGAGNGDAAEAVVGAELENEDVDGLAEDPIDAAAAARGGFAADAGACDLVGKVEGVDPVFDEVGEGLAGGDPIAGGEAVAKEDDMFEGMWLEGGDQKEG